MNESRGTRCTNKFPPFEKSWHHQQVLIEIDRCLRELLIYFFNMKKSGAEAHRLLVETYGEAALSEKSCRKWFQKFKHGEFDIEDKERSRKPKMFGNAELEVLLDQESCQTQEEQYDGPYSE